MANVIPNANPATTPGQAPNPATTPGQAPNPPVPSPTQALAPEQEGIKSQWLEFFERPETKAALLQFGINVLQPTTPGQSELGHISSAFGGGLEAAGRVQATEREAAKLAEEQAVDREKIAVDREATQAQRDISTERVAGRSSVQGQADVAATKRLKLEIKAEITAAGIEADQALMSKAIELVSEEIVAETAFSGKPVTPQERVARTMAMWQSLGGVKDKKDKGDAVSRPAPTAQGIAAAAETAVERSSDDEAAVQKLMDNGVEESVARNALRKARNTNPIGGAKTFEEAQKGLAARSSGVKAEAQEKKQAASDKRLMENVRKTTTGNLRELGGTGSGGVQRFSTLGTNFSAREKKVILAGVFKTISESPPDVGDKLAALYDLKELKEGFEFLKKLEGR